MTEATFSDFSKRCGRPQRVCWVVAEHEGHASICPLGWHMNTSSHPPMMAISVAPPRFTHDLIADSGECVLAWPGPDLAQATLTTGTTSGRNNDKFSECDLTRAQAKRVHAPLIKECVANLECTVAGQLTSGDHTIFALEVVAVWLSDNPVRVLCLIGEGAGYEHLLSGGAYRFGVVKE